ncbi:hypothetical protein BDA96_05G048500 [Sorghum bicolor]|uniref:Uncharacterized protein n=1 Tax=Sorghum bicolor TaxID=4558 RepID=A0A921QXV3_SORBI|nr:hypothetical protein BDA96_05G048500 [Sorghum bicolor]
MCMFGPEDELACAHVELLHPNARPEAPRLKSGIGDQNTTLLVPRFSTVNCFRVYAAYY